MTTISERPARVFESIAEYLRASFVTRETHQSGPFLASITSYDDNPYLNYALPDDGATPSRADVDTFIAFYRDRERQPRLEYIPDLAPAVEAALINQGFTVEGRLPLMLLAAPQVSEPEAFTLTVVSSRDDIAAILLAQNEAYGGGLPSVEDIDRVENGIARGSIHVVARDSATGEPAGGGVVTRPIAGAAEIAGIGVRKPFRRRGLGQALAARLGVEALGAGLVVPFLMAAGEDEGRMYDRAGFVHIGRILHISLPPDARHDSESSSPSLRSCETGERRC